MTNNKKQTSKQIASIASDILKDQNASQIQKSLAESALSQSKSNGISACPLLKKNSLNKRGLSPISLHKAI